MHGVHTDWPGRQVSLIAFRAEWSFELLGPTWLSYGRNHIDFDRHLAR